MSLNSKTGTAHKGAPPGIELAHSLFTAQPNEEAAVVDVYKVSAPSVFSSISESFASDDLISGISNILSGIKDGLSGVLAGAQKGLGELKKGLQTAQGIKSQFDKAQSAIEQFNHSGTGVSNLFNAANQLTSRALSQNLGPAANLLRKADSLSKKGKANPLSIVEAIDPKLGSNFRDIKNRYQSVENNLKRIQKGIERSDLSTVVNSLDNTINNASRIVDKIPDNRRKEFNKGFINVLSTTTNKYQKEEINRGVVRSLSDVMDDFDRGDVKDIGVSGSVVGLSTLAAEVGNYSVFNIAREKGMSDKSAFIAGGALTNYAASMGHLTLLKNIASDPVGLQSISINPHALRACFESMDKAVKASFEDALEISKLTGQDFIHVQRAKNKTLDASSLKTLGALDSLLGKIEKDKKTNELTKEMALLAAAGVAKVYDVESLYA